MKKKHAPVKLSTLTVLSVAIATLVAVAVSITVFSSVYSRAGRRDAQVNSEQAVRQTAVAIDNQIDAMKARLSKFMKLATESHSADDFLSQIKALTELEENIYAIIVYDDNGNIVSCAGSGFEKKKTSCATCPLTANFSRERIPLRSPSRTWKPSLRVRTRGW